MLLRRARLRPFRLELRLPILTSRGSIRVRSGFLIELEDEVGRVGHGEATPYPQAGTEDLETCQRALVEILDALGGGSVPAAAKGIDRWLEDRRSLRNAPAARFAIELALLDLIAQRRRVPLARLLRRNAPLRVPVNALLPQAAPAELINEVRRLGRNGFRVFKIKIGAGTSALDRARVAAVRAAAGPRAQLRVDANRAFRSVAAAAATLQSLKEFQIEFCEEPLAHPTPAALARLRKVSPIPIAADESLASPTRALGLVRQRSVDILVLKPMVLGGMMRALELARRARRSGIRSLATTTLDGVVGRLGAAHLAAALPASGLASSSSLWSRDRTTGSRGLDGRPGATGEGMASPAAASGPRAGGEGSPVIECPVARSARLSPNRPALLAGSRTWSYRELDDEVARAVTFLRSAGIGPDQHVAAVSENAPELVVLIHAAARLGAPLALLHPRLTIPELQGQLARIQPRIVFAPGDRALSDLSAGTEAAAPAPLDPERVQTLQVTSGSSGTPKAVALTVGNHRASAIASGTNLGSDPDQCWLACLPLCHVGGLAIVLRAATYSASLRLLVYDTDAVAELLARGGLTHLSLVPTMLSRLIECGAFSRRDAGLRAILVGGAPSDAALWERARSLGLPVARTYGLTEAASQVTTERPGEFSGTSGRPLAGLQVRIVDAERRDLPAGTTGEIEVCGPTVMPAYLADPDATLEARPDRWLRTHDLGALDGQGRLLVAARLNDLILSGGENIAPAEVEAVLCAHPQIAEAAVLAVTHSDLGQAPLAVLVARGERPSEEALRAWCRSRLAPFKCPSRWVFVAALPRTPVGKLDRAALRNAVAKDLV